MIEIQHLTKRFGQFTVVNDLSFSVQAGSVLGFLGPNGAGKSTTMKMITGFLAPTSGKITVHGYDVSAKPLHTKKLIGYLPEGAPNYGDMTPYQFLRFIAEVRGFKGAEKNNKVGAVVEQLSLASVLHQPIDTLSKGFKRRVGLAQAIIHDPKVLILDEPTDGLDPNQKHEVRNLIAGMAADKIIIISTHILEEVSAVCSRALIIAAGKIVADGTPAELEAQSHYHHAITLTLKEPYNAYQKITQLAAVASVELNDNTGKSMSVFARENAVLYPLISSMIQQEGWEVEALHTERGRLDDVFRQVTAEGGRA
jgi:ABC-2 type transport system ATP-binding protein